MSASFVVIGLAITSSWGNGHATTYRSLLRGLQRRGHRVLFLERDRPWYASHRDAPALPYCQVRLYGGLDELRSRFTAHIRTADAVIVGSYVPDGRAVCDWVLSHARGVRAFYDIDTPVTLAKLQDDTCEYLRCAQVGEFDLMLSFTGGSALRQLEHGCGAKMARALYCSVDTEQHRPRACARDIDLGYLGTYSLDRQPGLEMLLNEPARCLPQQRFAVAGAQYPPDLQWPVNVRRYDHLGPDRHTQFYGRQRYALNLTRAHMRTMGYSPSVRLFEAAACGTPVISDVWPGLESIFTPGSEILPARSAHDVIACLQEMSEGQRVRIAKAARDRVLVEHSGTNRASQLERSIEEAAGRRSDGRPARPLCASGRSAST